MGQKVIIIRLIRIRSRPTQQQHITDQSLAIHTYPAEQIILLIYQKAGIIEREWMHKFFSTNKKKPLRCLLTEYRMAFICKYVCIYI